MNSYGMNVNGMQEMALFSALDYLHVLWDKSFDKQSERKAQPVSRKAAAKQSAMGQLDCCASTPASR